MINITLNEKPCAVENVNTIGSLADRFKPGADVLILNGFPVPASTPFSAGDSVFLIKRGETPAQEELEALMAARHTPGVHAQLKAATVGIAGAGGLGSAIAVALARIGVGKLIIADFDVVEPSNLNRQQYFIDQIGMLKVDALAENLKRLNPYVKLMTIPELLTPVNIPEIFSDCSIVVEALDRADMKAMLVDTVLEQMPQVTVVAASGLAGYGPNNDIITRKASRRLYLSGDGISAAQPGCGLMAPRVAIAAGHQANQVVRIILGKED